MLELFYSFKFLEHKINVICDRGSQKGTKEITS